MPFPSAAWNAAMQGIDLRHTCAHCGKPAAQWRCEVQGPDDSWLCYRFWCNATCHANWSTNQPVNKI